MYQFEQIHLGVREGGLVLYIFCLLVNSMAAYEFFIFNVGGESNDCSKRQTALREIFAYAADL